MSLHIKFRGSDDQDQLHSNDSDTEQIGVEEPSEEDYSNPEKDEPRISKGMSMEELLKLREKIGTKAFTEQIAKREFPNSNISKKLNKKRANKDRPLEVPMMRKRAPKKKFFVTKKNEANPIIQPTFRDPRFDDISGKLDISAWKKNYSFIHDKRVKEKLSLKTSLKQEKDIEKCKLIKKEIQRMNNQEREFEKYENKQDFNRKQRTNAIQALEEGFAPKFATRKERKSALNQSYMDKLKKENKVDKYYTRKEKKQQSKEFKKFKRNL